MTNLERAKEFFEAYGSTASEVILSLGSLLDEAEARGGKYTIQAESRGFHRGRKQGIEESAKEADRLAGNDKDFGYVRKAALFIALAIRALDLEDGNEK